MREAGCRGTSSPASSAPVVVPLSTPAVVSSSPTASVFTVITVAVASAPAASSPAASSASAHSTLHYWNCQQQTDGLARDTLSFSALGVTANSVPREKENV